MTYELEEISDRLEIQDVLARYVHAFDKKDYDVLERDVFTADARFDFSHMGGPVRLWPEMKDFLVAKNRTEHDLHVYGNVLIEFDADRSGATTHSKVLNPQGVRDRDGVLHLYSQVGVYEDRWERTAAGWRICARRWHLGWIEGDYPFGAAPGAGKPRP